MAFNERYKINDQSIANAPRQNGVYILYKDNTIIYIGRTDNQNTITARLQSHKRGDEGSCTQQATSYSREPMDNPSKKAEELLIAYKIKHEKLPLCNERIG